MKPTQLTELLANIKSSFVSFFAILMFVALGVGVFTGLYWSAPALQIAANNVFDEHNLYDFSLSFPYGFTEDDRDQVLDLDGIEDAVLSRESYETYTNDDDRYTIKLQTLTETINTPILVDGSLPTEANEIALKHDIAETLGLAVGDTITFDANDDNAGGTESDKAADTDSKDTSDADDESASSGSSTTDSSDDDGMTSLNERTFTITALVESPEYLAHDTSTLGIAPTTGLGLDGIGWILADAFDGSAFNDGYPTLYVTSKDLEGLDTFSDEFEQRSDEIKDTLTNLGDRLSVSRIHSLKDDAQSKIDEGRDAVANGRSQVDAAQAQIDALRAQTGTTGHEFTEEEADANPIFRQIVDQEASLEDTRNQLADQEKQLDQSQADVDAMTDSNWSVSPREYNGGIGMVDTTSSMTNNLSFSMASLFVIVGLLVTYSTVSRLAYEQITQIGTKKALGLRNREITLSFLLYATFAVIAGVIIGIIAAIVLVEGILIHAIGERFIMGAYAPYFGFGLAVLATLVELALILFSAWFACRTILRGQAVELLRGQKPPEGKTRFFEGWALWNKLPLYTQTIVNNCLNDKRRVFSTIIGVAGITALVVTAITLNNDIQNSFNRQYGEVYGFDTVVAFDPDTEDAQTAVDEALVDEDLNPVAVYRRTSPLKLPDGGMSTIQVIVPQSPEDFSSVFSLHPLQATDEISSLPDRSTQELLSLDGAWVSQAYHDNEGAQVGDVITFTDASGTEADVPILGFYEYYLPHFEVVLSEASYEHAFGEEAQSNAFLVELNDGKTASDLRASLKGVPGTERVIAEKEQQAETYNSLTSVTTAVVLIYLALSVLMAIVVLLNLNVMFIEEKKRELIVLMINGFSVHDAKRYVYNDTILLTFLGIIVGLILGTILGGVSVGSIQSNSMHFFDGLDWIAILAGFVSSGVLAFIMSVIALRRIPRFELTDINKM